MRNLGISYLMEDDRSITAKRALNSGLKNQIKVFLSKKNGIPGFFFSGNSLDLNVIENVWSTLKRSLLKLKSPPKEKKQLKRILTKL